jgi:hypothetical protein
MPEPSQTIILIRSLRSDGTGRCRRSMDFRVSATNADNPWTPRLKSIGCVAIMILNSLPMLIKISAAKRQVPKPMFCRPLLSARARLRLGSQNHRSPQVCISSQLTRTTVRPLHNRVLQKGEPQFHPEGFDSFGSFRHFSRGNCSTDTMRVTCFWFASNSPSKQAHE